MYKEKFSGDVLFEGDVTVSDSPCQLQVMFVQGLENVDPKECGWEVPTLLEI